MTQKMDTLVYAAKAKDAEILRNSSSGGMFTVLSDRFLDRGYPVACCIYNYETHEAEYRLVFTRGERDSARGSKYVQSNPGDIYIRCTDWLKQNPEGELLFVGLGCQAAAFRQFAQMKGVADRAMVVDIICHGAPSPKLWKDYIGSIQNDAGGRAEFVTFKDKRNGWKTPTAFAKIGGRECSLQEYVRLFYSRCALRPSCHRCPYATVRRQTDMTIGDFWGIDQRLPEQYDPMGNSLVLIHTERGKVLFEQVKDELVCCESNTTDCLQPNLQSPTPVSENRARFWRAYSGRGMKYVVRKYGTISPIRRVARKARSILRSLSRG